MMSLIEELELHASIGPLDNDQILFDTIVSVLYLVHSHAHAHHVNLPQSIAN